MSRIYEVRSIARGDGKLHAWGARRSRAEAEALIAERTADRAWADQYHERWWIEEIDTTGLFEFPSLPKPRDRYTTRVTKIPGRSPAWGTLHVAVVDRNDRVVAEYDRNYAAMFGTFEPFRQGERMFALVSIDYTATAVLDLGTGKVIAAEQPSPGGFCPVGFYVPDWWDINNGTTLPGSMAWKADCEQPKGDFGFVWGCVWGDDSTWKVQYLDLSRIEHGEIRRDERFGYLELADNPKLAMQDLIRCSFHNGRCTIQFTVLASFERSGKRIDPLE